VGESLRIGHLSQRIDVPSGGNEWPRMPRVNAHTRWRRTSWTRRNRNYGVARRQTYDVLLFNPPAALEQLFDRASTCAPLPPWSQCRLPRRHSRVIGNSCRPGPVRRETNNGRRVR
jgi:hypothetical protein